MTKRPAHRPALPPEQRKSKLIGPVRANSDDQDRIAIIRHCLKANSDSAAIRKALEWTAISVSQYLTEDMKADIIRLSREGETAEA